MIFFALEYWVNGHYIYITMGKNPLEEMDFIVGKEPEMQYLDAVSKTTEWTLFISKASHLISQ